MADYPELDICIAQHESEMNRLRPQMDKIVDRFCQEWIDFLPDWYRAEMDKLVQKYSDHVAEYFRERPITDMKNDLNTLIRLVSDAVNKEFRGDDCWMHMRTVANKELVGRHYVDQYLSMSRGRRLNDGPFRHHIQKVFGRLGGLLQRYRFPTDELWGKEEYRGPYQPPEKCFNLLAEYHPLAVKWAEAFCGRIDATSDKNKAVATDKWRNAGQ